MNQYDEYNNTAEQIAEKFAEANAEEERNKEIYDENVEWGAE